MNNKWQDEQYVLNRIYDNGALFLKADPNLQNDRAFVLKALQRNPEVYSYLNEVFQDDKEITLLAVSFPGNQSLRYASKRLRDDEEVVLCAIENTNFAFSAVSDRLKNEAHIALLAVKKWPRNLQYASFALRDNKAFAEKMLAFSHHVYYALSPRLQADETIMRLTLNQVDYLLPSSFIAYDKLPEHLQKDRDFMLLFITKIPANYPVIREEFKNDRAFAKAYAAEFRYRSKPLPDQFMRDKEIALLIVKSDGLALEHLAETFSDDDDVVRAAVSSRGKALIYASSRLRKNVQLCASALSREKSVLPYIDQEILFAPPIVAARVKYGDLKYNDLPLELREDAGVTVAALKKIYYPFEIARLDLPEKVFGSAEVILQAARKSVKIVEQATPKLRDNKELIRDIIAQSSYSDKQEILQYVSPRLQDDFEVVSEAVTFNPLNYLYASESLRDNDEISRIAVAQKPELYGALSKRLQEDDQFIIKLLQANDLIFARLSEKRRGDVMFVEHINDSQRALRHIAPKLANDEEFIMNMAKSGRGRHLKAFSSIHFSDFKFMKKLIVADFESVYALKIKRDNVPNFQEYLTPELYEKFKSYPLYKITKGMTNFDFYFTLSQKGKLALRDFDREFLFENHEYTPVILTNLKGRRHKKKLLVSILLNAMKHEYMEVIDVIFKEELIRRRTVLHYYGEALQTKNKAIIKLFSEYIKPLPITYEELIVRKKASGW
ncbi:MAG TPA: DUF4116 domain-containing protein [Bacilli bacterium]|nr:DUF4116 domain-containing protein [Bacilli bacterium]